jgi:excisionase family DNA binding protein
MLRYMSTDVEQPRWLTAQEIAQELRCDVASVYRAVKKGDLKAVRLTHHGALRIHRSVLDQQKETTP